MVALGDTPTASLDAFKEAVAAAKADGDSDATLFVRHLQRAAVAAAHLAHLKAAASKAAAAASAASHFAAETNRLRSAKAAAAVARESTAARARADEDAAALRLRQAFLAADRNRTGLVRLDAGDDEGGDEGGGMRAVVTAAVGARLSDPQWAEVLEHGLDVGVRGRPAALPLSGAAELVETARLCLVFAAVDDDGGGSVTPKELAAVLASVGHSLSAPHLAQLFAQMDPSGDGEVSLGEFLDFFRHTPVRIVHVACFAPLSVALRRIIRCCWLLLRVVLAASACCLLLAVLARVRLATKKRCTRASTPRPRRSRRKSRCAGACGSTRPWGWG